MTDVRGIAALILAGLLALTACASDNGATPAVDGSGEQLCALWTEFDALINADEEPSDALIGRILELERAIEAVLPEELSTAWNDITSWTAAFIEYFSVAGYQAIDEAAVSAIFGSEQAADDAAQAMEAGLAAMRGWSAGNCVVGEGDARAFCAVWPDISAQLALLDQEAPTEEAIEALFAGRDAAAPAVPAEIRDHWDAVFAFAVPFRDVLVTVEYDLDRASDEFIAEAFGSLEAAESLELAADRGREAIESWSRDGCGDFCARLTDTREAIDQLSHDLGWVVDMGDEGPARLLAMQARLELATQQLPEELRPEWGLLTVVLSDWYAHWEALGYNRSRLEDAAGLKAAADRARAADYFANVAFDIFNEGPESREEFLASLASWPEQDLAWAWMSVVEHVARTTSERIEAWAAANCNAEGGLPGRLRVIWPRVDGAAGSAVALAVMPPGAAVASLGDVEARLAGFCEWVGSDPWGFDVDPEGTIHHWQSDWLLSEMQEGWGEDSLCDFAWEEGAAVLEPGSFTLLAVVVPGGIQGRTLPGDPTACLALDVVVDGDTTVQLPPLPACDAALPGLLADVQGWPAPEPVDPSAPGVGTLRVRVPSLTLPEGIQGEHGGELSVIVLPAGTTLNDVGRELAWPSGGYRQHLPPAADDMHAQEMMRLGAVAVPIVAVPPNGAFAPFDPWWLAAASDADLPLVPLAPGEYDVYVDVAGWSEDGEDVRCGRTSVTIDGPMVIDMPELGPCP